VPIKLQRLKYTKFAYFSAQISEETGNKDIDVRRLDLGSFDSVREFCKGILASESHLDVLIHNAGCADTFKKHVSPDGIELTLATNHYGPFLMTHLLMGIEILQLENLIK
jgi:retinol dehydrogenase 14